MRFFKIIFLGLSFVVLWAMANHKTIFIVSAISVILLLIVIKVVRKRRKKV